MFTIFILGPGWASASVGCLLCIECSGMHRGLGVHISKVKSLSLDKWDTDLVEVRITSEKSPIQLKTEKNDGKGFT